LPDRLTNFVQPFLCRPNRERGPHRGLQFRAWTAVDRKQTLQFGQKPRGQKARLIESPTDDIAEVASPIIGIQAEDCARLLAPPDRSKRFGVNQAKQRQPRFTAETPAFIREPFESLYRVNSCLLAQLRY